jgi:hypothetical protein
MMVRNFVRSIRARFLARFRAPAQPGANGHDQSRVRAGCGRNTEVTHALSGVLGVLTMVTNERQWRADRRFCRQDNLTREAPVFAGCVNHPDASALLRPSSMSGRLNSGSFHPPAIWPQRLPRRWRRQRLPDIAAGLRAAVCGQSSDPDPSQPGEIQLAFDDEGSFRAFSPDTRIAPISSVA